MPSAQQTTGQERPIIIHHLSDLHYEDTLEGRKRNVLVKYKGYLETLPAERHPEVIIITGDMTSSGTKRDLETVATILRTWFPKWENQLHEHVFIVPGPRDINWEGETGPGLAAFFDTFREFALPTLEGAPSGRAAPGAGGADFIVYSIDTCYSPDDLRKDLKRGFARYVSRYKAFMRWPDKLAKRNRGLWKLLDSVRKRFFAKARSAELKALRKRFLGLTEGAPPIAFNSGRVTPDDISRFQRWANTVASSQPVPQPPQDTPTPREPLKILITHHPLAIQPEQCSEDDARHAALRRSFQHVAKTAREAGFHLALHGHIHKPQVLSDLSILEGLDGQSPMRQIGAASLDDTGLFNEITAYYHRDKADTEGKEDTKDKGKGVWRLELRLVNVTTDTADRDSGSSFVLLNPAETADDKAGPLKRSLERREEFERRMRIGMRRYSELVFTTQYETRPERLNGLALPQDTMQFIEGIIRDVIFDGFQVRARLLLKNVETHRLLPKLVPKYLTPAVLEGPESLVYPASVAAWSLVLGRTLMYPRILEDSPAESDLRMADQDWLRRSDKIPALREALEQLMAEAAGKSNPGPGGAERYEGLSKKLIAIGDSGEAVITGKDIYQEAPGSGQSKSFPSFICVPYPMRSAGGALPSLPEIVALDIGVRPMARHTGHNQPATPEEEPFTPERRDMLESLTELIGLVLTASSALNKPRGMWDDRTRA